MNQPETARAPVPHAAAEDDGGVVAMEVAGPLGRARFPELCVRCGAPADRTVALTKLFFRSSGDGPGRHFADGVAAPACRECAALHEREVVPIGAEVKRRLLRSWALAALPFVVPVAVITWMLGIFVPNLLEALRGGEPVEVAVWAAVCGFFGLLGLMFWGLIMRNGRPMVLAPGTRGPVHARVERGPLWSTFIVPAEPTAVARAVDFGEDVSEMFEPERHRFTFRNYEVAARFAELNAGREWDPGSRRAQLAATGRRALIGAVVLGAAYLLAAEFLF